MPRRRTDKERLDHIQRTKYVGDIVTNRNGWSLAFRPGGFKTLRQAIDAAMSAEAKSVEVNQ